jgi:hypothetical protein
MHGKLDRRPAVLVRSEDAGLTNSGPAAQNWGLADFEGSLRMIKQSAAYTASRFRYRGYGQTGTVREFTFEDPEEQGLRHRYLLRVDTGLLRKHHVRLQEAPTLCLLLLAGLHVASSQSHSEVIRRTIADNDLTDLIEQTASSTAPKHGKKASSGNNAGW